MECTDLTQVVELLGSIRKSLVVVMSLVSFLVGIKIGSLIWGK